MVVRYPTEFICVCYHGTLLYSREEHSIHYIQMESPGRAIKIDVVALDQLKHNTSAFLELGVMQPLISINSQVYPQ